MNKIILFIVCGLLMAGVSGCDPEQKDITDNFILPPELKDYKLIQLFGKGHTSVLYVFVKNKEDREVIGTSTTGKVPVHVVTVDGEEYSKIEKIKLEKE
jgi:hypothetical protein